MHTNDSFRRLVSLRGKVRFILAFLVLACHAFFVGGIAFYRDLFATPVQAGSTMTFGILATVGVIVAMIFLEFIYILISDKWLDPLQMEIKEQKTANSDARGSEDLADEK